MLLILYGIKLPNLVSQTQFVEIVRLEQEKLVMMAIMQVEMVVAALAKLKQATLVLLQLDLLQCVTWMHTLVVQAQLLHS